MRKSVVAAVAVLLIVVFLSPAADAQTHRKPVRKVPVKTAAPKPSATVPAGALRTPSGLTYMILQKGTGRLPKAGETVIYNYTGTFTNGKKFDSSYDEGREPLAFTLGSGELIKGMDEAASKLRVGDRAFLMLPPEIAYGARNIGNGLIPPNSTLVFLVEIMDVKSTSLGKLLFDLGTKDGVPAMLARYQELKKTGFGDIYGGEAALNTLGYRFLRLKNMDAAIAVLKLVVEEYPKSANAYDSLGEAYATAGQKQLAIETYEKALAIDPKFPSAIKALEKLKAAQ